MFPGGREATGNRDDSSDELPSPLRDARGRGFAVDTRYFVRSANEWQAAIDANPFPDVARRDPSHLVVMFLQDPPQDVASRDRAPARFGMCSMAWNE